MMPLRRTAAITVNCRIGSLEMRFIADAREDNVNCRIGSLEKEVATLEIAIAVNCRIGSLEKTEPSARG